MNNPNPIAAIARGQNPPSRPQGGTKRPHTGVSAVARVLDQYFTRPCVASHLYEKFKEFFNPDLFQMVEPSAGTGAFSDLLPSSRWAYDLDPQGERIVQADFLKTELISPREIVVIGNPPFGKNASIAICFFNQAAKSAKGIAFIVPRSFRKASIINRLNPYFHLIQEEPVGRDAFIFGSKIYDVPCVFQIWKRREHRRARCAVETRHPDFEFTTADRADFSIQRIGVKAGLVHDDFGRPPSAHYFIRGDVEGVMTALRGRFRDAAADVAGNPSLAKSEIVALYREYIEAVRTS